MKNALKNFLLLISVFMALSFTSCSKSIPTKTKSALGTVCTISLFENGDKALYEKLFSRIDQIEGEMSSTLETSEIYKLNELCKNSTVRDFPLSDDTFYVLENALRFANLTGGAFNPVCGSLVKLWNINEQCGKTSDIKIPSSAEIENAKSLCDYNYIKLNAQNKTVSILKAGAQIELGGIAKGFVADELVKILREENISSALINLGGNIYAVGTKKTDKNETRPWKIGIRNPEEGLEPIAIVECNDLSVVTSGAYERFFEYEGKIYHHIIDTKSGLPSESDLSSVSIICENSMLCDAFSTACFIYGKQKSIQFLENLSSDFLNEYGIKDGVKYVLLGNDGIVSKNVL